MSASDEKITRQAAPPRTSDHSPPTAEDAPPTTTEKAVTPPEKAADKPPERPADDLSWAMEARLREINADVGRTLAEIAQAISQLDREQHKREEERRAFTGQWLGGLLENLQQQIQRVSGEVNGLKRKVLPKHLQEVEHNTREATERLGGLERDLGQLQRGWEGFQERIGGFTGELKKINTDLAAGIQQSLSSQQKDELSRLSGDLHNLVEDKITSFDRTLELNFASLQQEMKELQAKGDADLNHASQERLGALSSDFKSQLSGLTGRLDEFQQQFENKALTQIDEVGQAVGRIREELRTTATTLPGLQEKLHSDIGFLTDQLQKMIQENGNGLRQEMQNFSVEQKQVVSGLAQVTGDAVQKVADERFATPLVKLTQAQDVLHKLVQGVGQRFEQNLDRGEESLKRLLKENEAFLRVSLVEAQDALTDTMRSISRKADQKIDEQLRQKSQVAEGGAQRIVEEARQQLADRIQLIPNRFVIPRNWLIALAVIAGLLVLSPWLSRLALGPGKVQLDSSGGGYSAVWQQSGPADGFIPAPTVGVLDGIQLKDGTLDIEGTAPWGNFVLLLVNGREKALRFIEKENYNFNKINLGRGEWQIQVSAFDNTGRSVVSDTVRLIVDPRGVNLPYLGSLHNISSGLTSRREVAITFDAGSNANHTQKILDILREEEVKSSMFLTGQFVEKFPEVTRRIASEGHEVGNHTYDHPHLTSYFDNRLHLTLDGVKWSFMAAQLNRTAQLYKRTTGREMARYWRAPFGEFNREILNWGGRLGYKHVLWTKRGGKTLETYNWITDRRHPLYMTAGQMRDRFLNFEKKTGRTLNGSIMLFHLGTDRDSELQVDVLRDIIRGLKKQGLKLVTVSELTRPKA